MTAEQAIIAMIQALNDLALPYVLVGSLSSNFHGIPRSTQDADVVLHLGDASISAIADRLGPSFRLDPQMSFEIVTGTKCFVVNLVDNHFSFELFLLSDDPHDQERFRRRCRVRLFGQETFLPTPEDVIITKLRWSFHTERTKDIEDVRHVIAIQKDRLDWDYVTRWCDLHGTRTLLESVRNSIPAT